MPMFLFHFPVTLSIFVVSRTIALPIPANFQARRFFDNTITRDTSGALMTQLKFTGNRVPPRRAAR